VSEKLMMSYRGARFELGRGESYFALWPQGAPREHPLEQWPATPEGWSAAWSRFTELETPGTIAPAGRRPVLDTLASARPGTGAALLAAGVVLGAIGLFPDYLNGQGLVSQTANLVPHVIYLLVWAASAALLLAGGARARIGALLGAGVSVVTFGLFLADAGQALTSTSSSPSQTGGAGLAVSCLGWLACAVGSVVAVRSVLKERPLVRPTPGHAGPLTLLILASVATAVTFAPAWDNFVLRNAAGASQAITAGNVFSDPALVIIGDIAAVAALVVVAALAGLWRSPRMGAVLLAGAIAPMVAQAVSALIQVSQTTPPSEFGYTSSQAAQIGLTITNGLTPAFWLYCVFLSALLISCAWMLLTPSRPLTRPAGQDSVPFGWLPPQPEPGQAPPPGSGATVGQQAALESDATDDDDDDDDDERAAETHPQAAPPPASNDM
jgi:hypothetical protein